MASMFEGPPQDSRIFAAPDTPLRYRHPARSVRLVGAAFAAGAACAFLVLRFAADTPKAPPPAPKLARQADAPVPRAPAAPPQPAQGANVAAAPEPAPPAETANAPADVAAAPPDEASCERQTWPYVNQQCVDAAPEQATREVRVIPTDRSAPATVVTAKPQPTTDGKAANDSFMPRRPPPRVGAVPIGVPTPAASDASGMVEENVPMPVPRPPMHAAVEPESRSVVRHEPPPRETRSAAEPERHDVKPSRERREKSDARRHEESPREVRRDREATSERYVTEPSRNRRDARKSEARREEIATVRGAEPRPRSEDASPPRRREERVRAEPAEDDGDVEVRESRPVTPFHFNPAWGGH
jgi:hypothetical protein